MFQKLICKWLFWCIEQRDSTDFFFAEASTDAYRQKLYHRNDVEFPCGFKKVKS